MDNGRGPSRARQLSAASLRRDNEVTRRTAIEGDLAASTEPRRAMTATRRLDATATDMRQQRAALPSPTPTAVWKPPMLTPPPAVSRHAPPRGFPTRTIPMLAMCHIHGCRRCSFRCRCWPCAASMDAADQDGTMTTLTINMRAAVFHLATLGFPRRPVFLPSTSSPANNRLALGAGSVKGGAGVRLPGFPVFCAPGYAPPSGGHSPALPPSSATGEDRRQFINDPGSD